MKKNLFILIIATFLLVGCSFKTYKSLTYDVETGDDIKVELKTGNGYSMKDDKDSKVHYAAIKFTKSKKKIATGYFAYVSEFDTIKNAIESHIYDEE